MLADYRNDREVQFLQPGRVILSSSGKKFLLTGTEVITGPYANANDVILKFAPDSGLGSEFNEISINKFRTIPVEFNAKLDEIENGLRIKAINARIAAEKEEAKNNKYMGKS